MTTNTCSEQIVHETYDEIDVLSPSESEFYEKPEAQISEKKSARKRPDLEREHLISELYEKPGAQISEKKSTRKRPDLEKEHLKTRSSKKKCKETTKDRILEWNHFYSSEKFGIWIQCTKCNKWRQSLEFEEEHQVPTDWCCSMNKSGIKDCNDPEDTEHAEFSDADFIPGSIVWAKLEGFPWWPGMVEDDPDIEEYYWLDEDGKMHYNVTFLDDKVSHAWVQASFVRSYLKSPPQNERLKEKVRNKYSHLIEAAKETASEAIKMSIKERLQNFSFVHRYKGKWPQAPNFDDNEDSKDIAEMLIKEIEDIDSFKNIDSENESDSSVEIVKENSTNQELNNSKNYRITPKNKENIKLKHESDVNAFEYDDLDEALEDIMNNDDEYFRTKKETKMKEINSTADSHKKKRDKVSMDKKEIAPLLKKEKGNKIDPILTKLNENNQTKTCSLETIKKRGNIMKLKPKSGICSRVQKITQAKTEKTNKGMNDKKKRNISEELENSKFLKSKKKAKLESTESGVDVNKEEKNLISNGTSNLKKKSLFQPPIKNNAKSSREMMNEEKISSKSILNVKISDTNVNDNIINKFSELESERISDEEESEEQELAKQDELKNGIINKLEIRKEKQKNCSSISTEKEADNSKEVSTGKDETEINYILAKKQVKMDLKEEKITSIEKVLEKILKDKTMEKNESKQLKIKKNQTKSVEERKLQNSEKENTPTSNSEKSEKHSISSLNFNYQTKDLDTNDTTNNEELQRDSKITGNDAIDLRDSTFEEKKNTSDMENLETSLFLSNKRTSLRERQNLKNTYKQNTATIKIDGSNQVKANKVKQNKEEKKQEITSRKTCVKPATRNNKKNNEKLNEKAMILSEHNAAEKESKIGVCDKTQKDSISKNGQPLTDILEKSTKSLSSFDESEQKNSYSLSLKLTEEQSENEDSDPFEAD